MNYYDVSIIVPVYNAEKYLIKCIESLVRQKTNLNYCVILVNDGSTDSSLSICNNYRKLYDNIYVYDKENGGTSTAKNKGIDSANSKYIMFVDSDDYVDDFYISSLVTTECDFDFISAGYSILYDNSSTVINNLPNECESKNGDISNLLCSFKSDGILNVDVGKVYLLRILNSYDIRFPTEMTTGEDLVFNCEYIKKISSYKIISKSSYYYIRRDIESLTNSYKQDLSSMVRKCLDSVQNLYESNINENNLTYLSNIYFDYRFTEMINLFRRQCSLRPKEKVKKLNSILSDEHLKEYVKTSNRKDFLSRIFKGCILINDENITYCILKSLFFLRYNFVDVYYWFRKRFILRGVDKK